MPTLAIPDGFEDGVQRLMKMSPEDRRRIFAEHMLAMASCFVELAKLATAMTRCGDDTSTIPPKWLALLLRIGEGSLLPAVLSKYSGLLRERICALPLKDQIYLIEGGKVDLVVVGEKTDVLSKLPEDLIGMQLKQVFAKDHIRSGSEQRSWIEERKLRLGRTVVSGKEVKIDTKEGTVTMPDGNTYTRRDLLRWLEKMA